MRCDKIVCVELGTDGSAHRVFKGKRAALDSGVAFTQMYYRVAVSQIRCKVFLRAKGRCELCSGVITEASMHLHEMKHRGRGGEISVDNSVASCPRCHGYQHRDRNPKFSKKSS